MRGPDEKQLGQATTQRGEGRICPHSHSRARLSQTTVQSTDYRMQWYNRGRAPVSSTSAADSPFVFV